MVVVVVAVMLSVVLLIIFMIDLLLRSRSIRNVPNSVRWSPFLILAHRELWTPEIVRAHRRILIAGFLFLGFVLSAVVIGLTF